MLTTAPRLPKMKAMRGKNTIGLCSCNQNCVLMTSKKCLELHGTLKLSTWLSNLLRAELRIVPLGDWYSTILLFRLAYIKRLVLSFSSRWLIPRDSYYPSGHAGLYQETRIILLFRLVYTKRLLLSFSSRWLTPKDSYYNSVHAGLYQETRIILLSTLVYTKGRNCHTVDGKVQGFCHLCLTPNFPAVIGSFHACPVTWSTSRVFVMHKTDITCFVTKVRPKNAVCV